MIVVAASWSALRQSGSLARSLGIFVSTTLSPPTAAVPHNVSGSLTVLPLWGEGRREGALGDKCKSAECEQKMEGQKAEYYCLLLLSLSLSLSPSRILLVPCDCADRSVGHNEKSCSNPFLKRNVK